MKKRFNRRSFLKKAGSTALGATAITLARPALGSVTEEHVSFQSAWNKDANRQWPGPEYWPNPLQDWRIRDGRLECFSPGGDRNVALLTRSISDRRGDLSLSVRFGKMDDTPLERGFVGFRVGIKDQMNDYRATAIYGRGMNAGINADGRLFIGTLESSAPRLDLSSEMRLHSACVPVREWIQGVTARDERSRRPRCRDYTGSSRRLAYRRACAGFEFRARRTDACKT